MSRTHFQAANLSIDLDTDGIDALIEAAGDIDRAVRKVAENIADGAEGRTVRIDTGAMKAGWITERVKEAHYRVGNTQFYATYQELGTRRGITPSPMLIPSVAAEGERFHVEIADWIEGWTKRMRAQ